MQEVTCFVATSCAVVRIQVGWLSSYVAMIERMVGAAEHYLPRVAALGGVF
jgi:hypothetical protein